MIFWLQFFPVLLWDKKWVLKNWVNYKRTMVMEIAAELRWTHEREDCTNCSHASCSYLSWVGICGTNTGSSVRTETSYALYYCSTCVVAEVLQYVLKRAECPIWDRIQQVLTESTYICGSRRVPPSGRKVAFLNRSRSILRVCLRQVAGRLRRFSYQVVFLNAQVGSRP